MKVLLFSVLALMVSLAAPLAADANGLARALFNRGRAPGCAGAFRAPGCHVQAPVFRAPGCYSQAAFMPRVRVYQLPVQVFQPPPQVHYPPTQVFVPPPVYAPDCGCDGGGVIFAPGYGVGRGFGVGHGYGAGRAFAPGYGGGGGGFNLNIGNRFIGFNR